MTGEAPKMTKREARNYILFPAIGGAVLGLLGWVITTEAPQLFNNQNQPAIEQTDTPATSSSNVK